MFKNIMLDSLTLPSVMFWYSTTNCFESGGFLVSSRRLLWVWYYT